MTLPERRNPLSDRDIEIIGDITEYQEQLDGFRELEEIGEDWGGIIETLEGELDRLNKELGGWNGGEIGNNYLKQEDDES